MTLDLQTRGPRTWIVALVSLVVAAVVVLWSWSLWQGYNAAIVRTQSEADYVSRLAEEYMRWTIGGSDLVTRAVVERANTIGRPAILASESERQRLERQESSMRQIGALWVFGPDGEALFSTGPTPAEGNFADRSYFGRHREGAEFVITPAVRGRLNGEGFFSVSRRLESGGEFDGVVMAAIPLDFISGFYTSLALPPQSVIGVYTLDGRMVVHYPTDERLIEADLSGADLFSAARSEAPSGTFETEGPDGVAYVVAYRQMEDMPLVVATSIPRQAALAEWRNETLWSGLVLALGLAVVMVLSLTVLRSTRLLEVANQRTAAALEQREVLFREMHHRTKNNLQMAGSLIALQFRDVKDPGLRARLEATQRRLSLMARVHEQMYAADSTVAVDCSSYIADICGALNRLSETGAIKVTSDLAPYRCTMERAIPLGLLVNEAVTNALKHAFPERKNGSVHVTLAVAEDGGVTLTIHDDGIGMPPEVVSGTLGTTIIRAMALQLEGDLTYKKPPEGGTLVTLTLPRESEAPA